MSDGVKILWGFLAGAAAGAIAGIVLAPEKGSVTRENIGKKASEFGEGVANTYKASVDKLSTLKDSAFSLVNSYGEEAGVGSNVNEGSVL
jgi:gas vesicle protein